MLFASYEFIGFILVLFVLYYVLPKKCQWPLLLIASYLFYFFSGATNLLYILFTTITTYVLTMAIQKRADADKAFIASHKEDWSKDEKKAYKEAAKKKRGRLLLLCILLNIGLLAVVKYTNFMINNINGIITAIGSGNTLSFWDIALPMGISFYIFKTQGYAIDVYRGKYKAETNIFKLALFTSFFPQLVQGPISRYDELGATLFEQHDYDWNKVKFGLQRILWGFFKKLVIADRLLVGVKAIIGDTDTYQGAWVFVGMMFYAVELYADFTGGIDITIGISQVLGIDVAENFIRPFFSKNIKEYWNRWHITMGGWFTDYIFYPISVSKPMLKLSHNARARLGEKLGKRVPVYLSSFAVWFATGIWHGASWNFIVWGIGNFVVIMISQELEPFYRWFHSKCDVEGKRWWDAFRVIRTIFIMSSLRTFDCYRDVPLTFKMYGTMFTNFNWNSVFASIGNIGMQTTDFIVVGIGAVVMLTVSLIQRSGSVRGKVAKLAFPVQYIIWFGLFASILIFGAYGQGFDASQFIYNQF